MKNIILIFLFLLATRSLKNRIDRNSTKITSLARSQEEESKEEAPKEEEEEEVIERDEPIDFATMTFETEEEREAMIKKMMDRINVLEDRNSRLHRKVDRIKDKHQEFLSSTEEMRKDLAKYKEAATGTYEQQKRFTDYSTRRSEALVSDLNEIEREIAAQQEKEAENERIVKEQQQKAAYLTKLKNSVMNSRAQEKELNAALSKYKDFASDAEVLAETAQRIRSSNEDMLKRMVAVEAELTKAKTNFRVKNVVHEVSFNVGPKSCQFRSSCNTCTEDLACVWCSKEKNCVPGNGAGPTFHSCVNFEHERCSDDKCKYKEKCNSCIASDCVWCESSESCFQDNKFNRGLCSLGIKEKEGKEPCLP